MSKLKVQAYCIILKECALSSKSLKVWQTKLLPNDTVGLDTHGPP